MLKLTFARCKMEEVTESHVYPVGHRDKHLLILDFGFRK